ncbi:hypothetical protein ACSD3S_003932 [Escherichia coli]|nr:hypothetical protein [Escherichia coli]EKG7235016.1 hypothetical protein [Escherichia coli]EKP2331840.1 hypothetical protein [Escherichia coli]ELW5294106.1 hypothetical protein [Escherichia coli]ELW7794616.1 hypothetical protein [Escherichia coli]
MNEEFQKTINSLYSLKKAVEKVATDETNLSDVKGVKAPALYPVDFLDMIGFIIRKIEKYGEVELTDDEISELSFYRLELIILKKI